MTTLTLIKTNFYSVSIHEEADKLWTLHSLPSGECIDFEAPQIELNGERIKCRILSVTNMYDSPHLAEGIKEYTFDGVVDSNAMLKLRLVFRIAERSPIIRFRYELHSLVPQVMTKRTGQEQLVYTKVSLSKMPVASEVRFSEFIEMVHSFCLSELSLGESDFHNNRKVMGPLIAANGDNGSFLLAYEHGSQVPDAFLHFELDERRGLSLNAVKGNYLEGQILDHDNPYCTIWLQTALVEGNEDQLAEHYRLFALRDFSLNSESRKPYIFYNTWNMQERSKHWHKGKFLDPMSQERILEEIDAAHELGIEVFVIDAGWFEKTGDWQVNRERFPDGLDVVKQRLDRYGMKMGLWFEPTSAALSSRMLERYKTSRMSRGGILTTPRPVWETEESCYMCLVSEYWEGFAEELIRVIQETGASYLKWDWIAQYGCSDPNHWHGNDSHSEEERSNRYAFLLGSYMTKVVDRVCEVYPEVIVDFDVTEGNRYVGLGFLSSGKYFLINNGPYYQNYDLPGDLNDGNGNIFFYPGQARGWITRTPLNLDKWLPSVLFLTHYYPDDLPAGNQLTSLASLMLGHNGIWGELAGVSVKGREYMRLWLDRYKQIRDSITISPPIVTGVVGGSPEIHEKINEANGKGIVSLFASSIGTYSYVTHRKVHRDAAASAGVKLSYTAEGQAFIEFTVTEPGAAIVLFGIR
ncbi:alpha-galactosidase [Paenibacillus sp. MMO-177]|uniref:alpha-galactosidase n=1 Tax=Paenibacillus sp. MMO-177 TaxID=3081289 RepID=UPI003016100E